MFFGFRRQKFLMKMLFAFLGFGFLFKDRMSEEDRKKFKHKAHIFRHKFNEALDVWDTEAEETPAAE